jgi:hypothetical protein
MQDELEDNLRFAVLTAMALHSVTIQKTTINIEDSYYTFPDDKLQKNYNIANGIVDYFRTIFFKIPLMI